MSNLLGHIVDACMRKIRWLGFSLTLFVVMGSFFCADAEASSDPITREQYQLLPAYCRNQGHVAPIYYRPDNETGWKRRLGRDYLHIHHYCWGIVHMLRAYKIGATSGKGKFQLWEAQDDFNFSINATLANGESTPGYILLPEMYTKLGETYLGMRDYKNAEIAFRNAWGINPVYAPPYVWWGQHLLKQGKVQEALTVAEEGKKNAPDSKSLDKLIEDIRGKGKAGKK